MKEPKIIEQVLPVIKVNFDEVEAGLKAELEKYENLVITAETLPAAKTSQKELSKMRSTLDGMRLDIQREVKKPLDKFNDQMKQLMSLVMNVEAPIKEGIAKFDQAEADEKAKAIDGIIAEVVAETELPEKYALMIEFDTRWLNKTMTLKAIGDAIKTRAAELLGMKSLHEQTATAIRQTVDTANKVHGLAQPLDPEPYITQVNDKGWPLPQVMQNINAAAEKQQKAEEAAVQKAATAKTTLVNDPPPKPQEKAEADEPPQVVTRTVTIKVTATNEKLSALSKFLKENGIAFEKLAEE